MRLKMKSAISCGRSKPSCSTATSAKRLTTLRLATMKTLNGFEQHSFSSLADRLGNLVSRTTIRDWVLNGTLTPTQITRQHRTSHILFPTAKLNALHKLLQKAQAYHASKVKGETRFTLAQRLDVGRRNAEAAAKANKVRRLAGKREVYQPEPAKNSDDAIGRMKLTYDPIKDKNLVTIFGGFGNWKK